MLQVNNYMEFSTLSFYVGIFLSRMQCFNKIDYFTYNKDPEFNEFFISYDNMMKNYLHLFKEN